MIPLNGLLLFIGAALLMVLTPGPNMIYLISRSICQGRQAGTISLFGVAGGFLVHVIATSVGLSAIFLTVPLAYMVLKLFGVLYLAYLAWQSVKPGARSPFEARSLPQDSFRRLLFMGFMTSALNPKVAVFYLSIFPQFISPSHGSVLVQSLILGAVQIAVSFTINLFIILSATRLSTWFSHNTKWLARQRYFMGVVLAGLAARLAIT